MKRLGSFFYMSVRVSAFVLILMVFAQSARAAVTVAGPPIDVMLGNETAGGGAYIPLIQFRLQGDGSSTLTSVKVAIHSTTTPFNLNNGEINKLYLYKESGSSAGFQATQDTILNTGANTVTDPATSTQITITVDTARNSISTTPTDYYVVGKATTSPAIVNGHALYATSTANWITTSTGDVGTEFAGTKIITLQQTGNLKISEVKQGATGIAGDEFVELYNASEMSIDLNVLPLNLYIYNAAGGAASKTLTFYKSIIPKQGFFLLASQTSYNGSTPADAVYSTSANDLITNGGLSIATSSALTNATSSAIDRIWWGAEAEALDGEGTQLSNLAVDKSYERKALVGSTNTTMASGGADSGKGNSRDSNDNSQDFVLQTATVPQNSLSPTEFPFGGGGQDTEKPRVMGSFPGPNQTGAPIDLSFIGFGFNKMVRSGTIVSAVATSTVTLTTGGGANLCTSVTYNQFPGNFEPPAKCILSANLSPSTTYTFTATSTILDLTGNPLDQDPFTGGNQAYSVTFTTGSAGQTMTNITPPRVTGTTPFPNSNNIPTNLAKIFVKFSAAMNSATLNSGSVTLSSSLGSVSLSSFSYNASTTTLSLVPATLSANTTYTLTVNVNAQSSNGIPLPGPYIAIFSTGSGTDSTAPNVIGIVPTPNQTLPLNNLDFVFSMDDNLDLSTATSGAVTLSSGGNNIPGALSYDSVSKEGHFTVSNLLPAGISDLTLTILHGNLKNVSGTAFSADRTYTWSTMASNVFVDTTPPQILFANADDFGLTVTFDEPIKSTDATTLGNYSLTVGGSAITLSSLAGHTVSYEQSTRTAKITGLRLTAGSQFIISVNNVADISGNAMTTASTFTGSVQSQQTSRGMLGPGQFSGDTGPKMTDFSSAGIGFMPGMKVMPMNSFLSASTTYGFELPISQKIPSSGTIVITFPQSSDFGLCCGATSDTGNPFVTTQNTDINGPGDNTVGFSSITKNTTAKTITLTTNADTNAEGHDFLRFAVVDIKNPSIPKGKDSSGYALDIKTKNNSGTLLESFTSSPIYINGGSVNGSATTTIQGSITGNGTGLVGVNVRMASPQVGMLSTPTDSSGNYSFTNVSVNPQISSFGGGTEFMLFTDPIISGISDVNGATSTAFFGEPMPIPVSATSTSIITRNFVLTATSSAIDFTVKITGDNSGNGIFTSGEKLDVFAGGPSKFLSQTYTTTATNYNGTSIMLVPIPKVNGSWGVGIGPSMPKMMGNMNFGPPPAPSWVVPKPVEVIISGCPSACVATVNGSTASSYTFTVAAANKQIVGVLKDGSGNLVSSAEVFAFSPGQGVGNRAQTSSAGVFTIKVAAGSYNVGAFIPGVGRSGEVPVVVDASNVYVNGATTASTGASGSNPFILTIKKSSYTITGSVTDGTNAVSNAPVFAYRTDGPGHIDAMTDSSGNYTLYVDTGTWKVNSFIPGFGPMGEQTVTITTASQSSINFAPSSATSYKTISGIVFESADSGIATSTEGVSGVIVRVSGTNGTNETTTGSDGIYSLRVPAGTYNFTDIFKPGYGKIAPVNHALAAITSINANADVYKAIRINSRNTMQIVVKDSNGNALTVSKAYIDLFDPTYQLGNHAEITNGTSTSLQIATGTAPMLRAFVQGVPPTNVSIASDNSLSVVSGGVLTVDNSTEYLKIVVNTSSAALSSVSGTVYTGSAASGNELADAWVQFVDPTNNVHFGTQATSSGVYVLTLANGTYQVQAMKSGYVNAPTTLTVSGNTSSANVVVSSAASSISGTVTAGGATASDAFVWAEKKGGGFAADKTGTSGTFTLKVDSGRWTVYASAEGYQKGGGSTVDAGASGVTIALTSASSGISSKTVSSNAFTDSSAGSFSDSTLGLKVNLDGGSLGSSGSSGYLSAKQTTNLPQTLDTKIIGSKGMDIDATNGSSAVTNLQSGKKAEITLNYTKADLTADSITTTTGVGNLKIMSWSDDKKAWESLTTVATYKDSNGNPVASPSSDLSNVASVDFTTSEASHFSEYALGSPSNADAPATPSGLSITQGTGLSAILSWTANTESDLSGYYVYRDTSTGGTFPLLGSSGSASYTDSTVNSGTTYHYKISAYDTDTNESAATGASSISVVGRGGGGSPSIGATAGGGGGGGGGSSSASTATTQVATTKTTTTLPATTIAQPSTVAQTVSPVFNKNILPGGKGDDVKRLQQLLKQDKSVYPEGVANGVYGPATARAVKAFQKKYGIIQTGTVGPATRAKLKEVFETQAAAPAAIPVTSAATPAVSAVQPSLVAQTVSPVFNVNLSRGSRGDDVKRLQELLSQDKTIYPEGIANGTYGPATEKAIQRFQEKYGIAQKGITGYGRLGPATRAKIQEVFGGTQTTAPAAVPVAPSAVPAGNAATVKSLQDQLLQLQQLLLKMKKK